MNILFVNYGDFTTNSLNHIGGFANTLCGRGHACVVAVPARRESLKAFANPLFIPALYEDLIARPGFFPDGRPADIIHAWTPREGVRKFVLAYQRLLPKPARVIVHLEDDEEFLISSFTGKSMQELRNAPTASACDSAAADSLPHPVRYRSFLRLADGVTVIVEKLREFVPPGVPVQLLPPGVDFNCYAPRTPDATLRESLGIRAGEKVIVFTGSTTFANEPDMRELYLAVALLNQQGVATRLIRTGFSTPSFLSSLGFDHKSFVLDLGFVDKARLPALLSLADVLVQPGSPGAFNDYRLPSKLPEFLASGRPVILPASNIASAMKHGQDAFILKDGAPETIVDACKQLFASPALCKTLGENGTAFAHRHFDLKANSAALADFYSATAARPESKLWARVAQTGADDIGLLQEMLCAELANIAKSATPMPGEIRKAAELAEEITLLTRADEASSRPVSGDFDARQEAARLRSSLAMTEQHVRNLDTLLKEKRRHLKLTLQLSGQHARNLEASLNQSQIANASIQLESNRATEKAASLEEALRLTEQHARNLEASLNQSQIANASIQLEFTRTTEKAASLEEALRLTEQHARNLEASLNQSKIANASIQLEFTRTTEKAASLEESLRLTEQHARNLEASLNQSQIANASIQLEFNRTTEKAAALEEALRLTEQHANNLETIISAVKDSNAKLNLEISMAVQKNTELENALQLTQQQTNDLKSALDQTQRSNAELASSLKQEILRLTNAVEAGERRIAEANKRAAEIETLARERIAGLEQMIIKLKSDLIQRDHKIQRMMSSFSWQSTAPFRALRRIFLDKPKGPSSASRQIPAVQPGMSANPSPAADPAEPYAADISTAPSAPAHQPTPTQVELAPSATQAPASPPSYGYTFNFDHPRGWSTASNKLLILGWCFENNGAPIKGLRARFGDRIVEGIYGSKRLDVMAAVGGKKQAEYCGIKIEIKTELGDHPLAVEVLHDTGWNTYYTTSVHVGKPGDPMELSEYEKWCEQHEALSEDDLGKIKNHITCLRKRPLISVIVPVYNPPEELFVKAIDSIRNQLYPHWELCIVDDASTQPHVRTTLERMAKEEPRIKLLFREKNGHISEASNSAIALATGEFLALFDHDDVLHRTALYEIAAEIDAHPEAMFLYTDEDKIDGEDHRFDPYFKPDWNPDLLLGQNFTSHLSVFRTDLIRKLGGFRLGYEGSQDWDLTLRVIDTIPESAIRHIPKVLYHWRAIPGSTALQLAEKNYPMEAAKRAILDYFTRRGQTIEILHVPGDHWRVKYPLPVNPPRVSLIIPTRNALKLVKQAVDSIVEKTIYPNYEIIVVDNNSDDPATLDWMKQVETKAGAKAQPAIRVLRYAQPFNYSAINNFAAARAEGEIIGLINNDIEIISPGWLEEMVTQAIRPGVGAVGAMLYYPMNTVQHAGVVLGLGGVAGHPFKEFPRGDQGQKNRLRLVQNYSAVTGACIVIKKEVYNKVGGLNEKMLAVAFNDVDLCCKLVAAGYRNVWTPHAELYHHESATRGVEDTPEKKARFQSEVEYMMDTWGDFLTNDPAYNPNLTLVGEDFSVAYLPRTKRRWTQS